MTKSVDLLIHGGTVVDGSGAPGFAADVAVIGDRLRILPRSTRAAGQSASADGIRGAQEATGRSQEPGDGWTRDATVYAARRIDATDHVVAPGFIDLHSHAGLTMLAEPRHEPKVPRA